MVNASEYLTANSLLLVLLCALPVSDGPSPTALCHRGPFQPLPWVRVCMSSGLRTFLCTWDQSFCSTEPSSLALWGECVCVCVEEHAHAWPRPRAWHCLPPLARMRAAQALGPAPPPHPPARPHTRGPGPGPGTASPRRPAHTRPRPRPRARHCLPTPHPHPRPPARTRAAQAQAQHCASRQVASESVSI